MTSGEVTLQLIRLFVVLLGASALLTLLARRINLPYTVALVAFGVGAGALVPPLAVEITPELVLVVLLPALIFEASYRTDLGRLRSALAGVALLAGPGVFVSAAIIAAALHYGAGLDLTEAFVVGAMLSATDPAAVISTFRRLRSPADLATIVEAESVFNDGTGIVLFAFAVDFVSQPSAPAAIAASFVLVVAASSILGAVAGYATSRLMPHVGDHLIEISLSVVLAYGVYLAADALALSGVIATAVAGIVLGNYGRGHGLSPVTEEALVTVWDFLGYLATAFVFLIVGFAIGIHALPGVVAPIAWAILAALVGRAVIVYGLLGGWRLLIGRAGRRPTGSTVGASGSTRSPARSTRPPAGSTDSAASDGSAESIGSIGSSSASSIPSGWLNVVFWAGLRGAVSTALALSLPEDFPNRAALQGITVGVVLFTLVVQATTAELVVARWGKPAESTDLETESAVLAPALPSSVPARTRGRTR